MRRVIALIGMRGAGKSTVGPMLAERLKWRFVDTDERVKAALAKREADLFASIGASFRDEEDRVLAEVLDRSRVVVATGGGCVERQCNRDRLAQVFTVWLTAPPEVLEARCHGSDRPPLTDLPPLDEFKEVLSWRLHSYAACSRLAISTENLPPEAVCDVIEHAWHVFSDHDVR